MKRLAAWWLRVTRPSFCFRCDRPTLRVHQHSDVALDELLGQEWRRDA